MRRIEKFAAVSAILGIGLLIVELFLCMIGLSTCTNGGIGTTEVYQSIVSGVMVVGIFFLILATLLFIVYAIGRYLENQ
jgi:hypothetical protein